MKKNNYEISAMLVVYSIVTLILATIINDYHLPQGIPGDGNQGRYEISH